MTCRLRIVLCLLACSPVAAFGQADFGECLARLERTARSQGIDESLIRDVFANVQPRPRVLAADRSQPEFVDTFAQYLTRRINERRIRLGRTLYETHRETLAELTRQYGIPGQYIVAFWGLETDFGNVIGDIPVFDSLSTLACDDRRGEYFSSEFLVALQLAESGGFEPGSMVGSWAGALGQTQFMPSNYLRYGVDGDADGRVDLWNNVDDALASAANFLRSLGWQPEFRWGREVRLPADFDYTSAGLQRKQPLSAWAAAGVTDSAGQPLPALDIEAAILVPAGHRGPAFVAYRNFEIIMRWNRSESFALTVGHLADRIAGGGGLTVPLDPAARVATARIVALQRLLNAEGFDAGGADGVFGPRSREALRALQADRGWIADGYVDTALLDQLGL